MVSVLGPLFRTAGHVVRTQHGVTASAGQWRTTAGMGFSLTAEPNEITCPQDAREGKVSDRFLAPPYLEPFASYGASSVARTSGRGHVAEAKDQCHRSKSGFLIRVSKETLLTLNVHFCVQFPAQRC